MLKATNTLLLNTQKTEVKAMLRKLIKIDESKCNGCGACAKACHEGAIQMINGVAKLTREDYCDGLGDCLPACPTDAISFEIREAPAYINPKSKTNNEPENHIESKPISGKLAQWPCQIKLIPVNAPYFEGANLLIAADCTAFAYGNFHNDFIKNHITLIGCPKLDGVDYTEKLTQIIKNNNIKSVKIVRMEVPCCGGLEYAVKNALLSSGKFIPWQVVTISTDGKIL